MSQRGKNRMWSNRRKRLPKLKSRRNSHDVAEAVGKVEASEARRWSGGVREMTEVGWMT